MKDYWERTDEYITSSGMRITRDTSKHPYCSPQDMGTTTHAAHVPLDAQFPKASPSVLPSAYQPKPRHRTDQVLSGRPEIAGGKLLDQTCFKDSYGSRKETNTRP
eukprot:scaffold2375_cov49-Prasinocladus_malaysianus.AAC.1